MRKTVLEKDKYSDVVMNELNFEEGRRTKCQEMCTDRYGGFCLVVVRK
jgi:hypothetical protein